MCGILGAFTDKSIKLEKNKFLFSLNLLTNRGPDSSGYQDYNFNDSILRFGHKRLSILDLSKNGQQPMISHDKDYLIIFNGEIYNHLSLRLELNKIKKVNWKSTCDTETLLEYFTHFGINKTLKDIEGMFAFSIYDIKNNLIYLSRDISGEKPLYIMTKNNFFGFSSTLRSLMTLSPNDNILNNKSISKYLNFNYIPSPLTIFNSCFKLLPGSCLKINLNIFNRKKFSSFEELIYSKGIEFIKFWNINNFIGNNFSIKNSDNIINNTEELIENSINSQLISDAPIGVFLSGGIDSSLILSLLKKNHNKINTFNMSFDFAEYDESDYATSIANYFNSTHTKFNCSKNEFLDTVSDLPYAFDEPFADSSQIPTMILSKYTKQHVKVVLGGDGGDELFGGYNRYLIANRYWNKINSIPLFIRKPITKLLLNLNINNFRFIFSFLTYISKDSTELSKNYQKVYSKLSSIESKLSFYKSFVTEWKYDSEIINFFNFDNDNFEDIFNLNKNKNIETLMMNSDFISYLPDDILTKVDRSSMFFGLEARSPFLNKNLIEYSFKIPLKYKINNGESKWILKEILSKYIPKKYFIRPKQGFALPIKKWLKGDLKEWTMSYLSKDICDSHGLFNYEVIENTYKKHMENNINNEHKLWSILQFNQWFDCYKKYISS